MVAIQASSSDLSFSNRASKARVCCGSWFRFMFTDLDSSLDVLLVGLIDNQESVFSQQQDEK